MLTINPSYPIGNSTALGRLRRGRNLGYVAQSSFTLADGTIAVVTTDGYVYLTDMTTGEQVLDPNLSAVFRQANAYSPGLVQTAVQNSSGLDFNSLIANISSLATTYVQASAQKDLLQVNLDRARQGLPPLNASAYMPGVNVGLTEDTRQMLYIGGAALLGFMVLRSMGRRG